MRHWNRLYIIILNINHHSKNDYSNLLLVQIISSSVLSIVNILLSLSKCRRKVFRDRDDEHTISKEDTDLESWGHTLQLLPRTLHLYHHDMSTHCSALTLLPIDLKALQEVPSTAGTTLKTEESMIRGKRDINYQPI